MAVYRSGPPRVNPLVRESLGNPCKLKTLWALPLIFAFVLLLSNRSNVDRVGFAQPQGSKHTACRARQRIREARRKRTKRGDRSAGNEVAAKVFRFEIVVCFPTSCIYRLLRDSHILWEFPNRFELGWALRDRSHGTRCTPAPNAARVHCHAQFLRLGLRALENPLLRLRYL